MVQLMQAQIGGLLLGNLPHVVAVYNGNGVGQIAERIEVVLGRAVSVVHELALAVHGVAVDVVAYVGAGNAHAAPNIGGGAGILGVLGAHAGAAHVIAGAAGGVHAAARNRNVIRAEVAGVALISYLVPAVGLLQYGNGRALGNLGAAGNLAISGARALTEVHVAGGGAGGSSGGGAGIVIAGVVIAGVPAGVPAGIPATAGVIAGVIVAAGVVVGQGDLEILGAEVAGVAAIDYLVPAVVAACVLKQGNGGSLGNLRTACHLAVIGAGALTEVDFAGGNGGADGLIGSHVARIVIVVIIALWFIGTYNSLVGLRNRVKDQWSQIDVQLKRRADLIPNLVETVKGYAKHEKSTFEDVVKARNAVANASTKEEEMKANGELSGVLNRLFALAEAYPELKANENFMSLQNDLKESEDKISMMRQFYNDTVLSYNNKVQTIPSNIVANLCHFKEETFFQVDEKDRETPKVSFE